MPETNRIREAFKESFNVVGLTTALAASAALLNPIPLLVAVVAEAAYLLFVPDTGWYEQRLSRRHDEEVQRRRDAIKAQILPLLRPEMQERYARLEDTRSQIAAQPVDEPGAATAGTWFREVLRKLEFLLEKFLQFAGREVQFRNYLASVLAEVRRGARGGEESETLLDVWVIDNPRARKGRATPVKRAAEAAPAKDGPPLPRDPSDRWARQTVDEVQSYYTQEMDEIRGLLEHEADENTKAVLQKRLDVLQRRHEFVGKICGILTNLNHQLRLVEDTFGLINDELRARSPEQVLSDIDDVVTQTNSMTQLLEEVAPYEQMLARLG
jgi:hypothetical protein